MTFISIKAPRVEKVAEKTEFQSFSYMPRRVLLPTAKLTSTLLLIYQFVFKPCGCTDCSQNMPKQTSFASPGNNQNKVTFLKMVEKTQDFDRFN